MFIPKFALNGANKQAQRLNINVDGYIENSTFGSESQNRKQCLQDHRDLKWMHCPTHQEWLNRCVLWCMIRLFVSSMSAMLFLLSCCFSKLSIETGFQAIFVGAASKSSMHYTPTTILGARSSRSSQSTFQPSSLRPVNCAHQPCSNLQDTGILSMLWIHQAGKVFILPNFSLLY